MNIRSEALNWLQQKGVSRTGCQVLTSKRYLPGESWTKEKAWWVWVPLSAIRAGKTILIVCQAERQSSNFRLLEVPAEFFKKHLAGFAERDDKLNLFLSAEPGREFREERGSGKLSLALFERVV
ncbi:MAG TPA: hypothetical protein VF042_05050 [Gemmatimonadaceae bacterium]